MKCWFHQDVNAVAVCKSCGKGVCQDCLVIVGGNSYCKNCIESGRVVGVLPPTPEPTVAENVPAPKGTPSKAFFVVGGVGCIVTTIVAIWFFLNTWPLDLFPSRFFWIGYVLLAIGLILASVGYFGMYRNYGSGVGAAGFALAIVVCVLFLLWTSVSENILKIPFNWWQLDLVLVGIYEIFFAMLILWGATHTTTKRFTSKSGLSAATGIMLIITAVFVEIYASLLAVLAYWEWYHYYYYPLHLMWDLLNIIDVIWILLFLVSEILAAILFFTAKVPESSAKASY